MERKEISWSMRFFCGQIPKSAQNAMRKKIIQMGLRMMSSVKRLCHNEKKRLTFNTTFSGKKKKKTRFCWIRKNSQLASIGIPIPIKKRSFRFFDRMFIWIAFQTSFDWKFFWLLEKWLGFIVIWIFYSKPYGIADEWILQPVAS